MILFWITLLLHQGHGLVPVITAHLGEATTLTCLLPAIKDRRNKLFWYRQTAGDTLEVAVKLINLANPEYGAGYSDSRVKAVLTDKVSNLTILKVAQEDEGMYHCGFTDWNQNVWQGMYLLIKGNAVGTSNFRVVQKEMVSDSDGPDDYVTLQCSILSDFQNKTCSEDLSVFWFRSEKSHPDIIYTDGNRTNRCQKKIDDQTGGVYNFSRKISSSDDGTYYCAVATCGEILYGNGAKLEERKADPEFPILLTAVTCLIISMIINAVFVFYRAPRAACKKIKEVESASSEERWRNLSQQGDQINEDGLDLNYAALHFNAGKATRGKKRKGPEDSVYSQIKL
ncbi:uncharacterized protein LOC129354962 [Poeciliopsis prolifica]|uniref:uncharacterized protein LOC129354962 n=1 Tax=Poeciliopsis prolifica TaxID=188132 RepID=UPI0024144F1E|nr:uncharacterized protein LOC129354962 [Poeciliopsis prolifica]